MRVRIATRAFCGFAALALWAGCGPAPVVFEDPEAYPFVQCSVKMGGKDVEGALVTFHGEGKEKIVSAYDDETKAYRFITSVDHKKMAGVPVGEYKVSVKPGRGSKAKIPEKYQSPQSSGLTAKVAEGKNFLPAFELTP
ncbi:MAG: hypothetical protein ACT4QC_19550 [Planctomycetaceae bacterium]